MIPKDRLDAIRQLAEEQDAYFDKTGCTHKDAVGFVDEKTGTFIHNPFLDTSGRSKVDPLAEYPGFISSKFMTLPVSELRELTARIIKEKNG